MSKYDAAESYYHELMAHIELWLEQVAKNVKDEHEKYGSSMTRDGYNDYKFEPNKGTPANKIHHELKELEKSDNK
ncbi:hypothetical protein AAG747_21730 [Rapidithrix thailandica]|uniref:Uncharacterized protein n=1 Tax=Rapidithrix thailandica TaxID=413964 RepID=A0AAW9SIA2_9BACT